MQTKQNVWPLYKKNFLEKKKDEHIQKNKNLPHGFKMQGLCLTQSNFSKHILQSKFDIFFLNCFSAKL